MNAQGQTRWSIPLPYPPPNPVLLRVLARVFLAGDGTVEGIVAQAIVALGRPWRWLRPLARRYVKAFAGKTRPRAREVVRFLAADAGFLAAWERSGDKIRMMDLLADGGPQMQASAWKLPEISTVGALASGWS